MTAYVIRRLVQMLVVLVALSFVLVALLRSMPGDPVETMISMRPDVKAEDVARLRAYYGLDDPVSVFYAKMMRQYVVEFDLGYSRKTNLAVKDVLGSAVVNTLKLTVAALGLSLLLAVPFGVYAALKQYSVFDYVVNAMAFVGISIPSFWLAYMLILLFSSVLGVLPPGGSALPGASLVQHLRHLILPTIALATLSIGSWTRYMRSSMLEVIKLDFVRTARAKGLAPDTVVWKHAFRNALVPLITIMGVSVPALFSGALITETVFSWPGMGKLLYDSVIEHDHNVTVVAFMLLAFLTLTFNLLADIGYAIADPRIRLG